MTCILAGPHRCVVSGPLVVTSRWVAVSHESPEELCQFLLGLHVSSDDSPFCGLPVPQVHAHTFHSKSSSVKRMLENVGTDRLMTGVAENGQWYSHHGGQCWSY